MPSETQDNSNFWIDDAESYTALGNSSLVRSVHAEIASLVDELRPISILDFGCGDGRLLVSLKTEANLAAYDISSTMLSLARERLGDRVSAYYNDCSDIPSAGYAVAICSAVLMCLESEPEYVSVLGEIHRILEDGGTGVFAVTHPCFRQSDFSDFRTAFTDGREFDYFANGTPFEVRIDDPAHESSARFVDYHWNMSFTVNALVETGFEIIRMLEPQDATEFERSNDLVPPYLIILARKRATPDHF